VADSAEITSFSLTPSVVTDGDTVTVVAEFSGLSAELSGVGEVSSGVPLSFIVTRTGTDPLEEREYQLSVHAASGDVHQSVGLTIHVAPVLPVISTVAAAARSANGLTAQIDPVLGLRYEWRVSGGAIVSSSTATSIVWNADAAASATLSCTAFNALGIASAPATVVVPLFGSESYAGVSGAPGYANTDRQHALFARPQGLALAADGSLYVSDAWGLSATNCAIRRVGTDGVVTTFSGPYPSVPSASRAIGQSGTAADSRFRFPRSIAALPDGTFVVADDRRAGALAAGDDAVTLRTLAADGSSTPTPLDGVDGGHINVFDMQTDASGALYIIGCEHDLVFGGCGNTLAAVYKRASGQNDWVKQGGNFFSVSPSLPNASIAVSPDGSVIYVGETGSLPGRRAIQRIRDGVVDLYAGHMAGSVSSQTDGPVLDATFGETVSLSLDALGRVYVVDVDRTTSPYSLVIRRIEDGRVTTIAGSRTIGAPLPFRAFVNDIFDLLSLPGGDFLIADSSSIEKVTFP